MRKYILLGLMCIVALFLCGSAAAADTPTAGFSANVTSGTTPLSVQFTDQSTGSPTSYAWNFGDGTTSTEQNPKHTYKTSGKYTVTQTVTNDAGTDEEIKTDYITVKEATKDITVSNLVVPSKPQPGKTYQVSFDVTNTGTADTNQFTVAIYQNTNRIFTKYISNLAAGQTTHITYDWTAPQGTINIKAAADIYQQVSETDETNNQQNQTVRVADPGIDLIVSNLVVPTNPVAGGTYQVSFDISNIGADDTNHYFAIGLFQNTDRKLLQYISSLAAGQTMHIKYDWTAPKGTINVSAVIDLFSQVVETNETNNQQSQTVIVPKPPVDLKISNLVVPTNPVAGNTYQISFDVTNAGVNDINHSFGVAIYQNTNRVFLQYLNSLAAGQTVHITYDWTAPKGTINLKAAADIFQQISETLETNNQQNQTVAVANPTTDLVVSNLVVPTNPEAGNTYQISFDITNNGAEDTGVFAVAIYLNGNDRILVQYIDNLPAGQTVHITYDWTAIKGTINISAVADIFQQVADGDLTNNQQNQTVTIT